MYRELLLARLISEISKFLSLLFFWSIAWTFFLLENFTMILSLPFKRWQACISFSLRSTPNFENSFKHLWSCGRVVKSLERCQSGRGSNPVTVISVEVTSQLSNRRLLSRLSGKRIRTFVRSSYSNGSFQYTRTLAVAPSGNNWWAICPEVS